MESKTKGILSIVFGVAGLLILPIILGPLAFYFGIKARKEGFKKFGNIGITIGSIAVLLIFLLLPILTNTLNTPQPVVVMNSQSMAHSQSEEWFSQPAYCESAPCTQEAYYNNKGISKEDIQNFPFPKGINKGDLLIIKGINYEEIKVGDVVLFKTIGAPVSHRVINIYQENSTNYIETKGDNNPTQITSLNLNEKFVTEEQIIGKVVMRTPKAGWMKIWLLNKFF